MSVDVSGEEPAVRGLRERKKERTRRTIRLEAFRLFREQGYGETTVEQIAAAAEVSPSTFFRYFPSKEQLVLADDLDPVLLRVFQAQPQHVPPLRAFRDAIAEVFSGLPAEELAFEQERQALVYHVPELRSAIGQEMLRSIELSAGMLAERLGVSPDDFEVRVFSGALAGIALAITTVAPVNAENLARAMEFLEAGLPLGREHAAE
ncbi:TetR family transcriptional regulator [Nocardia brasiliensis]|uniref:TetR family transcriptional regulator n=1 Tax=Nocardia brasiliensis TaxID=37326 RepID=A0A6G9XLU3_NOCBR|nr:TetR family transcriptional regulator [Nocardia brasiliensis]QIS01830.1 TetR family transcriptional regulator [Nocardia brasiliensis]